ncbi:hypothetical protein L915_01653, partial [Phytophthora nicotianae]
WAILADTGYQGISSFLRGILPKKGRNISLADLSHNDKVAHDRVIVENFFGRLNQLWRITSDKLRLGRDLAKKRRRLSSTLADLGGEADASEDAMTQPPSQRVLSE